MRTEQHAAALAEGQHGTFNLRQILADGATRQQTKRLVRRRSWDATGYEGVYRVPGSPRTWEQELSALVQAAGPDAVASHRAAAVLLAFAGFKRGPLEVTTPRPLRQRASHAEVHSSRVLPPHHLTVVNGIPTTRVARTLVDLAGVLPPARIERAVDSCLAASMTDVATLREVTLELAQRGRRGITVMRGLLAERAEGYVAPASELEARFRDLLRGAGLPEPTRQLDVGDDRIWVGRVDVAYPSAQLVIELDSRLHHSSKTDMEADRTRDNQLVAGGWRVVRITWKQLTERPEAVVALVRRLLRLERR